MTERTFQLRGRFTCLVFSGLFLLGLIGPASGNDEAADAPSSKPIEAANFSLLDQNGKHHELRRQTEARAVVLMFTGNGCPIARQSVSKLRSLRKKFGEQGIVFWMVNANPQDDRASIVEEATEFKIDFPILKDETQLIASGLDVQRTAEVIAINPKDWTIFYRGAIDDQLGLGTKKPKPTEKYLETALTQFLAGQKISTPKTSVAGCLISFEKSSGPADGKISYVKDVAPILQKKCVACHSTGNIGPFAMSSYKKVQGYSEMIREMLLTKRMPPWHADPHYGVFGNDRSLTTAEMRAVIRWIESGAPRGEGEDPLVNEPAKLEEWRLGKPDYIVSPTNAIEVPATGVVDYIYEIVDSPLTEDAWLSAAVIRPGNKKVVHHVVIFIEYPKGYEDIAKQHLFFAAYAPGAEMIPFPEGTGKFLPKGAKFKFQLHYNTIGKPETDRSELGLYVMKSPPLRKLETRHIANMDFTIPPGEPDARTFATYSFPHDAMIYDLIPHMHLRGSWFRFEALYPDGKREVLLSVPNYDFNWQTTYRLAEPKRIPGGTWILCTAGYDNSKQNPANPDPSKRVKWGDQSFEEMFLGLMNVVEVPSAPTGGQKQARLETPASTAAK